MDIGRRLHLVYQQPEAAQPPEEFGVIYNRISTSGQEDGTSLETQLENNTHMAGLVGVPVAPEHIINEVWSGADPSRSGFTRVREFVSNGVVQHVFVNDTDRLARDPWHVIEFIRFCKDHGATLHFSDGTTVETVLDEALQYFKGLFGFQEREKIAARTMLGKVATARAGRMPNGTGRGPFGYDYDKVSKTRSINEAEASIVRLMFEWALGGVSCNGIARRLRKMGVRTKGGSEWDSRTVYNVLRNEAYTGTQWWGRYRHELVKGGTDENGVKRPKRKVTLKPKEEWILLTGFSPAIIERAVYDGVQRSLEDHRRGGTHWEYIFSKFFRCGECGSTIAGATQKGRYPYYRCNGTVGGLGRPKICDLRSFRADKLEPVVWRHICAVVQDPSGIIDDLRRAYGDGGEDLEARIFRLRKQVQKRRLEVATLVMQRTKGLIDQDMLETLIAPVNQLLEGYERDIGLLVEQKKLSEGLDQLEERIRAHLTRYAEDLSSLDSEGKRRLMRLLNVQLIGGADRRVMVTGVLDLSVFTTGQTLALPRGCSPRSRWGGTRRDWKRTRSQW